MLTTEGQLIKDHLENFFRKVARCYGPSISVGQHAFSENAKKIKKCVDIFYDYKYGVLNTDNMSITVLGREVISWSDEQMLGCFMAPNSQLHFYVAVACNVFGPEVVPDIMSIYRAEMLHQLWADAEAAYNEELQNE
jgi:hypothetical protein